MATNPSIQNIIDGPEITTLTSSKKEMNNAMKVVKYVR